MCKCEKTNALGFELGLEPRHRDLCRCRFGTLRRVGDPSGRHFGAQCVEVAAVGGLEIAHLRGKEYSSNWNACGLRVRRKAMEEFEHLSKQPTHLLVFGARCFLGTALRRDSDLCLAISVGNAAIQISDLCAQRLILCDCRLVGRVRRLELSVRGRGGRFRSGQLSPDLRNGARNQTKRHRYTSRSNKKSSQYCNHATEQQTYACL